MTLPTLSRISVKKRLQSKFNTVKLYKYKESIISDTFQEIGLATKKLSQNICTFVEKECVPKLLRGSN